MKEVARICFKYWLAQSNVLFIIGGKSNNTDIFTTFRAMGDALREHFSAHGPTPLYVVVGRGGPNLIRGMGALQDTVEALGLPYRFFGFNSAISEVVNYAQAADRWMKARRPRAGGPAPRHAQGRLNHAATEQGDEPCTSRAFRASNISSASTRWPRSRPARTGSACSTSWAANRAT